MVKRDKKTGKLCVVLQHVEPGLYSDDRFVILGTETTLPPLTRARNFIARRRKLSELEDVSSTDIRSDEGG